MAFINTQKPLFFSYKPQIFTYNELDTRRLEDSDLYFLMRRQIESAYKDLPWPSSLKEVVVFTRVVGGKGDISAAAKVIALMQRLKSDLKIDWILHDTSDAKYDARLFLSGLDNSRISIRRFDEPVAESIEHTPVDLVFTGPYDGDDEYPYLMKQLKRPCTTTLGMGFREIGARPDAFTMTVSDRKIFEKNKEGLLALFSGLFPSYQPKARDVIVMGLFKGSGVFLDKQLAEMPLSRRYSCPLYLKNIEDQKLLSDLLARLGSSSSTNPNMDTYSLNFGYAHMMNSWTGFIDCIAVHEKEKNIVLVLNQMVRSTWLFPSGDFADQVFDYNRIEFLLAQGFGEIVISDETSSFEVISQISEKAPRSFHIILRKSFLPKDMRSLQLASERILATGDNSAVEAFCSRCKLFLYETLNHKQSFLQQQVDLARSLGYRKLARLWGLFGRDIRMGENLQRLDMDISWGPMQLKEMTSLLQDESLSKATLGFCHAVVAKYNFENRLEALLKRSLWHHVMPDLKALELDVVGEGFVSQIQDFLSNTDRVSLALDIPDLSSLSSRLRQTVLPSKKAKCVLL